jgi:cellobiose-specific phosphotransferase system component IIC
VKGLQKLQTSKERIVNSRRVSFYKKLILWLLPVISVASLFLLLELYLRFINTKAMNLNLALTPGLLESHPTRRYAFRAGGKGLKITSWN